MSPRSAELIRQAHERLATLTKLSPREDANATVSLAYYAMLYAARAVLSERGRHARTHRGTWQLVREELLASGELDRELIEWAQRAQELREGGDYGARDIDAEDAEKVLDVARRFVAAIDGLLGQ